MKYFSLFSGIGGFELGIQRALPGAECVGYSEVDKYAEAIYRRHFPGHRGFGDATGIIPDNIPDFDLLVAGFPCQSFSVAGKRQGFQDTRGILFFEIIRILRDKRPRYFLLENVKGLLSAQHGETFQAILGILSDSGYLLQWEVLNSRNYGVPQNRDRVFFVGHLRGEPRPEVFPIGEGREVLSSEATEDGEVVNCIDSNYYKGPDGKPSLIYVGAVVSPESTKRIDDGKQLGRNYREGQRVYDSKGIANALSVNKGYYAQATGLYLVDKNIDGKLYQYDDYTPPLRSAPTNYNMALIDKRGKQLDEVPPLTGGGHSGGNHSQMALLSSNARIRRLTPVECERLQGFPDNWTEYGINVKGEELTMFPISDTQRYKVLGNAVTVNVVEYVMQEFDFGS